MPKSSSHLVFMSASTAFSMNTPSLYFDYCWWLGTMLGLLRACTRLLVGWLSLLSLMIAEYASYLIVVKRNNQ